MVLVTRHAPRGAVEILRREVDPPPSLLRCLLTLNASYFAGTSPVCGRVTERGFELRNRSGPGFSPPAGPDPVRRTGWLCPAHERQHAQQYSHDECQQARHADAPNRRLGPR